MDGVHRRGPLPLRVGAPARNPGHRTVLKRISPSPRHELWRQPGGHNGLRTSLRRRRLSERNKTCALMLLTPRIVAWPLLAVHLCALAIEGTVLGVLRRDTTLWRTVYVPAIATPFRDFHSLSARRLRIQSSRMVSVRQWFSTTCWQLRKVVLLLQHGLPRVDR